MESRPERDCTLKCRSSDHAKKILSCVLRATPAQIRAYSVWLCYNFTTVADKLGRNILHIAASCGKKDIVEWLLQQCNTDVDIKDLESGWTALHRCFFYGQLDCGRTLINHGANIRTTDHEGFTPLDLLLKDRLPYVEYIPTNPSEVYAWGSNFNYSLGSGNTQGSATPDILEVFRKDSINIKQSVVCKFHSAFLSVNGKVYTCGYGLGGRLGQGSENTCLLPSLVKGQGAFPCIQIAAGQDHLLLLFEDGQVMSCGLNVYHQLGHNPPIEQLLIPKSISLKILKGKKVVGLSASRFHSVIYTKDAIFTFGLNAGQLGHSKGDRTVILPKQVSSLCMENQHFTHVEASDGAIVCATSSGDVYVLHEYQCRKIASRQLEILKLSVVGGHLDTSCGAEVVKEGGGLELRVILLTKSGKVYLWRDTDPHLRRCLFSSPKQLIISDIHINHHSIAMITSDNEGYMGHLIPFKGSRSVNAMSPSSPLSASHSSNGFNVLLDKEDCNFVRVKRLPHIHRGTSITSDSKGRNFVVLQSSPKMGLGFVELPMSSDSCMQSNFSKLLAEADSQDGVCDIVFKVGTREFAAHKYILASRCEYFKKQFSVEKSEKTNKSMSIDDKINMLPEAFEQILKFLYSNSCDFLIPEYEVKWDIKKESSKGKKKTSSEKKKSGSSDPLKFLKEASKSLNLHNLSKRLEDVRLENKKIKVVDMNQLPNLSFDRCNLLHLSDVNLHSESGKVYPCHKCILVSRLDYFRSMLSCCWIENSQLNELTLPISSEVLEVILEYLYTDRSDKILVSEDTEFLIRVLMVTDQLLISRLKEICEMALVELITLKNVTELLELASVFNSAQLKKSCMEYICINITAIVEAKGLDILSDEIMNDLSAAYRQMIPSMRRRTLKTNVNDPSSEDLAYIETTFPISNDYVMEKNKGESQENKPKSKKRSLFGRKDAKGSPPNARTKNNSESSEKDIILDIVVPKIEAIMLDENFISPNQDHLNKNIEPCEKIMKKRPPQWIMNYPKFEDARSLDKIMFEEQKNFTVLHKSLHGEEIKPIPHISQKKKKLMAVNRSPEDILTDTITPKSPPCPWAKAIQPSPPSPSFWETLNKRNFEPLSDKRELFPSSSNTTPEKEFVKSLDFYSNPSSPIISLDDIQRAEERKLRSAIKPKIKPLDIINIEDQAIEELLMLYNAQYNPDEKIKVTRVLPEIASPIWKKHV